MKLLLAALLINLLVLSICEESKVRRLGRSKNYFISYIKDIQDKLRKKFDCPMLVDQLLPDTEDVIFRNRIQTLLRMKTENESCSQTEFEPEPVPTMMIKNKFKTKKLLYDKESLQKCNVTIIFIDPAECGDLCNDPYAEMVFDPEELDVYNM